ncbi:MAG: acyltransferase [Acaryochloridaceae cyanobacterium SU_2_1]|nr:acyltransferase [Acaryochloridaceae cyanobacterium SU_2_1]
MKNLLRKIIPIQFRISIQENKNNLIRSFKSPKMLGGYRDSSGAWRAKTRISDTAYLYHPERILIEDNVFVWHHTILDGTGMLTIGEGTQIGAWVGIFTHSSHISIRIYGSHYQEVAEQDKKGYKVSPVTIGKYTFIGAGAKVLPGTKIGKGAIISAGSIVSKDVGDFEIVAGDPAEVIGNTKTLDKRYLKDKQILEWYNAWQED